MTDLTHDSLRELAPLYVVHALEADERAAFERHLQTCDECSADVRSLRPIALALAQGAPQQNPPAALRARILSSAGVREARAVVPEMPPPAPAPSRMPWLAAAAALVAAIGLGAYAVTLRTTVATMQTQLNDALDRLSRSEARLAAANQAAETVQARLAVLTAPDVLQVALSGQPPAPTALGRAFWSQSRGAVFAATSLPPLQTGRTYQLWFLTSGAPVSAGIFKPDVLGRAVVTVDQSPPGLVPTGLAVSLEPDGGVPAPTGALYLVGLTSQ